MPYHGSILAVDDTEASLQILSDLLREAGHSVRTALSGRLALLSAAHRVPDLILLDICMPDMDGFEVCRQLKAQAETRDVPVIFISALSDTDEKVRSFQLGAVDYVTKPFQRDELLARVSTHIHLRQMQLQVNVQNEELRQYRAQLEDLVAQRTAELQSTNQQLRLMNFALDQVREAAYLMGPEGRLIYVNQEACRAHGYSAEELGQMHLRDIDPNFSEEFFAAQWRSFGPDDAVTFETLHRRRDGSVFPVEIHCSTIRFDGRNLALSLARDISERKDAERRLRDSYAQLQELNSLRESDREDERKRIAHELHDELGQCLTALRIGISTLRYREERDGAWMDARLAALTAQVDDTIRVVRSVTVALRPPVLGMGIGPALEWLVAQFQKTTDLGCEVHIPSDFCGLTEEASVALYRIAQEALTNVARHSQANTVRISGRRHDGGCQLNIVDDGTGIHTWALDGPSLGLLGMRERAQQLGGTVVVDAAPGRGTRVSVWIPSPRADT